MATLLYLVSQATPFNLREKEGLVNAHTQSCFATGSCRVQSDATSWSCDLMALLTNIAHISTLVLCLSFVILGGFGVWV